MIVPAITFGSTAVACSIGALLVTGCGKQSVSQTTEAVLIPSATGAKTTPKNEVKLLVGERGTSLKTAIETAATKSTLRSDEKAWLQSLLKSPQAIKVNGILPEDEKAKATLQIGSRQHVTADRLPMVTNYDQIEVFPGDQIRVSAVSYKELTSDPSAVAKVPRVVLNGYPDLLNKGMRNKRWPVRVECADPKSQVCLKVRTKLIAVDIPAANSLIRSANNPHTARVAVGTIEQLQLDPALQLLLEGPQSTGLEIKGLNNGRLQITTGPKQRGSAAVAVVRYRDEAPSVLVFGSDDQQLDKAIRALDQKVLAGKAGVLINDSDDAVPIPVVTD